MEPASPAVSETSVYANGLIGTHEYFSSLYLASSSPKQESRKEVNIVRIYKLHALKLLISLP